MFTHPPLQTVAEPMFKEETVFKPMDIVFEKSSGNPDGYVSLGVVLLGPLYIPHFEDGVASEYSKKPLDVQNPDEWRQSFEAYVVFDLCKQTYAICVSRQLVKLDGIMQEGYIPFDQGTGRLRTVLGLIGLADKWYGKSTTEFLKSINIE